MGASPCCVSKDESSVVELDVAGPADSEAGPAHPLTKIDEEVDAGPEPSPEPESVPEAAPAEDAGKVDINLDGFWIQEAVTTPDSPKRKPLMNGYFSTDSYPMGSIVDNTMTFARCWQGRDQGDVKTAPIEVKPDGTLAFSVKNRNYKGTYEAGPCGTEIVWVTAEGSFQPGLPFQTWVLDNTGKQLDGTWARELVMSPGNSMFITVGECLDRTITWDEKNQKRFIDKGMKFGAIRSNGGVELAMAVIDASGSVDWTGTFEIGPPGVIKWSNNGEVWKLQ